ncbi:MAG: hypothetical protein LBO00_01225 [Zoogloeaceae bacterium]|jgi:hypothetical protein|nr:hypothetical protein [Zoogloeaceae bacterium]
MMIAGFNPRIVPEMVARTFFFDDSPVQHPILRVLQKARQKNPGKQGVRHV